jgi:hypothetical protein
MKKPEKPVPGEEMRGNSAVQQNAAVLTFPRFSLPAPVLYLRPLRQITVSPAV